MSAPLPHRLHSAPKRSSRPHTTPAVHVAASAILATMLLGCGTARVKNSMVLDRAKIDLECGDGVSVSEVSQNSYQAQGCEKKAMYNVQMCAWYGFKGSCTVELDSGPTSTNE